MPKEALCISKKDFLFYMAFGCYFTCQFFSSTLFSNWINFTILRLIMFFFVSLVLGIKFLSDRNYKNSGIFITILILAMIVGLNAENLRDLILMSLFLLEARNMEFKKFVEIYLQFYFDLI